jgi:hypothetical protein
VAGAVADIGYWLIRLRREYNTTNPFDFMIMVSLQGKQTSLKKEVAEYQKRVL